jgi:octanoyl-[GcvH]:protein N-octanoyltransferase
VPLRLLRDVDGRDPAEEIATGREWLERIAGGDGGPGILRVYRPAPTVAFGRLDAIRPGYDRAFEAAAARGFEPVLRVAGGHAAAFHAGSLVIEEIVADADPIPRVHDRFAAIGELLAAVLQDLGVDARVGEVPGEYCPGRWSVNARGAVKLAGSAQRVIRGGYLLGATLVVEDAASLAGVLTDVYAELGLPLDPATVGAAHDESAAATLDAVEAGVIARYA